jgi:hypothetical protein
LTELSQDPEVCNPGLLASAARTDWKLPVFTGAATGLGVYAITGELDTALLSGGITAFAAWGLDKLGVIN